MSNTAIPLTQAQILGKQLTKLSADVTAGDRAAFMKEFGFSKGTISAYLKGKVLDNDTAVLMIKFFGGRIKERYNAVGQTV